MRSTLLLASLLAVPFVSASPTRPLAARQATPTLVQNVSVNGGFFNLLSQGDQVCFVDSQTNRLLAHELTPDGGMTPEKCSNGCNNAGFKLAGVENSGASCFCADDLGNDNGIGGSQTAAQSNCEVPCSADGSKFCGGFNFMLIYKKSPPS